MVDMGEWQNTPRMELPDMRWKEDSEVMRIAVIGGWPDWDIKYGIYRTYKWMADKMGIPEMHQY